MADPSAKAVVLSCSELEYLTFLSLSMLPRATLVISVDLPTTQRLCR